MTGGRSKFSNLYFLQVFRFASTGKQTKEPWVDACIYGQYNTWTADCGLRTEYKTRTRYKMWTKDYVG